LKGESIVAKPKSPADERLRLTIQTSERAVVGRIESLSETGLMARLDGDLVPDVRYSFLLHVHGGSLGGQVEDAGSAGDLQRLRFVALSRADLDLLQPYFCADE
jgi:hypothetical protein